MKIGITGSTGNLGTILVKKLLKCGFDVVNFTDDVTEKKMLFDWVNSSELDVIYHLAAIVPTDIVAQDPFRAYCVNVGGTINLLSSLMHVTKKPWVFYASTSHVYKSKQIPINESDPLEPISTYGVTKMFAEKICLDCLSDFDTYKIPVCCGRMFSFYHKDQKKSFLYPSIMERLATEDLSKPFKVYNADSIRDFLNVEEVADILIHLMQKKAIGVFNIASGKGIKIKDFVQGLTNVKLDILALGKQPNALVADISKLKNLLHYEC